MKIANTKTTVAIACALFTTSCAIGPNGQAQNFEQTLKSTFASDDPCSSNARNIGILSGAIVGALLSKNLGDGKTESLAVGAGLGALVGGLIGVDMDRRRCELSKVAKEHNLDIQMTDITLSSPAQAPTDTAGLIVRNTGTNAPVEQGTPKKPETVGMSFTVFDHGNQFAAGSATPSVDAQKAFAGVADKYAASPTSKEAGAVQAAKERTRRMRILLIGHTDDTGSSKVNADLSEERARAIARIFSQRGFDAEQIYYQGAGEVFPIADNRTEDGRAQNRRVEIVDLSDDAAFQAFLASRRPNVAHYRPESPASVGTQITTNIATRKTNKTNEVTTAVSEPAVTSVANASSKTIVPIKPETTVSTLPWGSLDFGGKSVNAQYKTVDIGKPARANAFSIISNAYAADAAPLGSCATDRPRISNRVKSLGSGQILKTSDYLPGTASSSWAGKVNGHLVGLTSVAVLRDGGQPASSPTVFIWKNWVDGSKASPVLKTTGNVNTYQGDKALLYRVFPAEGPVRCLDIVIPNGAPGTAPTSTFVYEYAMAMYQADYSPTISR